MIAFTPNAAKAVRRFIKATEAPVAGLRLFVSGFSLDNPNATAACGCGKSFSL